LFVVFLLCFCGTWLVAGVGLDALLGVWFGKMKRVCMCVFIEVAGLVF
jgi:hypothetical protein